MAKAVKHTVPGAVGVRKSPRTYTHAIIGRVDWDAVERNRVDIARSAAADGFGYYSALAKLTLGTKLYPNERPGSPLADVLVEQEDLDRAEAWLKSYGRTKEEAIAKAEAAAISQVAASKAKTGDQLIVLQWSQSEPNARKALGTWQKRNYLGVTVVPVERA